MLISTDPEQRNAVWVNPRHIVTVQDIEEREEGYTYDIHLLNPNQFGVHSITVGRKKRYYSAPVHAEKAVKEMRNEFIRSINQISGL